MQQIDNLIRQEFKYYVSAEVISNLRTYLKEIMKVDENANSENNGLITVSLGEKLLLTKVSDVIHRRSNCTELEFSNGRNQQS